MSVTTILDFLRNNVPQFDFSQFNIDVNEFVSYVSTINVSTTNISSKTDTYTEVKSELITNNITIKRV